LVARRLIAIVLGLAALAASGPARADTPQAPLEETHPVVVVLIAFGILVMPSDIGFFTSSQGPDFTLAWSWQVPVTESRRHRVLIGLDWIPTSKAATARGRLGYRYANKNLIAGLALAYAQGDTTWSPELGLRFGPERRADVHLLARAEIPVAFDGFRGVALLLGWDML
jgi:hypothetical protein